MAQQLAIVTGYGSLSDQVLTLAGRIPEGYSTFTIKPWLPLLSDPVRLFNDVIGRSTGAKGLNPFHFSDIEHEFIEERIGRAFFTGDFPRDRFVQAAIAQAWSVLGKAADKKCRDYLESTDSGLSGPMRYFLALARLLGELHIRPLLACEIFPELNVPPGNAASEAVPQTVLDQLPSLIVRVAEHLSAARPKPNRFAQAVIVDGGIVIETERSGTNELCHRYGRSFRKRVMPFLLKLPSVEFYPALDQPTIGPDTVKYCHANGIRGMVICTETTTVANRKTTIEQTNARNMFLYALPLSQLRAACSARFPNTWTQNASIAARPLSDAFPRPPAA